MFIFGFAWGCVNIFAWFCYFAAAFGWLSERNPPPYQARYPVKPVSEPQTQSFTTKLRTSKVFGAEFIFVHIFILFPVAVIMALGPFFSPFAALPIVQRVREFLF